MEYNFNPKDRSVGLRLSDPKSAEEFQKARRAREEARWKAAEKLAQDSTTPEPIPAK
jgi:hypothetical protein